MAFPSGYSILDTDIVDATDTDNVDAGKDHATVHNEVHAALNDLAGLLTTTGDLVTFDGTNWVRLPQEGRVLALRQNIYTVAPVAADEFNDETLSGTELTVTGTATWTEHAGLLSVLPANQSAGDLAARLWALPSPSVGMTVEVALESATFGDADTFAFVGFSDGVVAGSNVATVEIRASTTHANNAVAARSGTATAFSTALEAGAFQMGRTGHGPLFMRIQWTATDTFKMMWSTDYVTWLDGGTASFAVTLTPTHYFVAASTHGAGAASRHTATFEYVRVYNTTTLTLA